MQISKAEILPRHALDRQIFEFKPDRLNLLSADEDQKKSDLFSAISGVIWGNPQEANGTADGDLKEASITLQIDGKQLQLSRDFDSNELDFKTEDANVQNTSDLLAGITREIFDSLFLVGQEHRHMPDLSDRTARLSLLGQFASLSEHSSNIDKAVRLVEEKLEKYPFRDKTYKIDDLIAGLTRGKLVLEERLLQLERERQEASAHIDELKELEEELAKARRSQKRSEYFQLCLETAELDARIMKVQQRLLYEAELKRELISLGDLSNFPISAVRKVQELYTMRQARLSDLERLNEEIVAGDKESDIIEESIAKQSQGLEVFSIEEAQQLYGLSSTITHALSELEQLQSERSQEMRRLKDNGIDFDSISLLRKSILAVDPNDLEEANHLAVEFKWQKDKLATSVEISESKGTQLQTLSNELAVVDNKSLRMHRVLIGLGVFSAGITLWFHLGPQPQEILATIFLTSFVLSAIALVLLVPLFSGIKKEMQAKIDNLKGEVQKSEAADLEVSESIASIQTKAEQLCKKYDFESPVDLFKKLQSYGNVSARLKQLDVLDHMVANREQQMTNLGNEAMTYFERINKKPLKVTPAAVSGLASEILRHKEGLRELERSNVVLNHRKSERSFLEGEINDIDSILRDWFQRARLTSYHDIESGYADFEKRAEDYQKWESLAQELRRMETDMTSEIFLEHDLATVLNKLQHKRTDAWAQMQDLISMYPDILSETIEDSEMGRMTQGEAQTIEEGLQQKQAKADSLRSIVRTAAKNFDEFHPKTQHELEILERDLDNINHNKNALLLARDSLRQVAQESKTSWSQELSEISEDMLRDAQLGVTRIEWNDNMDMTLTLRKHSKNVHESELPKKASKGLLKQINWLTRLMLCRYIARRLPLPVVLDEPFSDLDDKRFAECMGLLLRKLLPHCQLIVLTCQKVRHEWFLNKLSKNERERISIVELEE